MEDRFKFRVWDIQSKEFVNDILINCLGELVSSEDLMSESKIFFNVQQCTGLKDKHGTLIYECDIVKYHDTFGWLTSTIIDVGGAFAVETDNNPILLYDFHNEFTYSENPHPLQGIEIIGNIYENHELLNKK